MSIPVDLAALGEALARHDLAYLLSGGGHRPHVAQVALRLGEGVVVVDEPGRTARRVVAEHPGVTLLLPPREAGGYSLLVDGDAAPGDGTALVVTPTHAVLHRAASVGPGAGGPTSACGGDCRPAT